MKGVPALSAEQRMISRRLTKHCRYGRMDADLTKRIVLAAGLFLLFKGMLARTYGYASPA
ncbi:hypothetical protein [Bosea thiooxidans]